MHRYCTLRFVITQHRSGYWHAAFHHNRAITSCNGSQLNLPGFLDKNSSLEIVYAFDYNISAFDVSFGTSHKLTLGYLFGTN